MAMPFYNLTRRPVRGPTAVKRLAAELLEQSNRRENASLPSIRLTPRPLMSETIDPPSNVTPISAAALANTAIDSVVDPDLVREQVRAAIDGDRAITQARVAKESGVSGTTVSQFLSDSYPGDRAAVAAKLARWLASLAERTKAAELPTAPTWFDTAQTQRILSTLRYAQLANDMVVIYGPAGVSKTQSCKRYAATSPNVFVVEMSPAQAGLTAALKAVFEAVGLKEGSYTAAQMNKLICQRLKGSEGLLVIDEAQHLGHMALDQIRSIHDATGIGIALVGNEQVYTVMTGGTRAAYLDRLFSRIGKRLALKAPAEADVDALIKAWRIDDAHCRQQIRVVAQRPGALRVLTKVLRLASASAAAANRPLCCDDVASAIKELGA
jgi:hypothetical protein